MSNKVKIEYKNVDGEELLKLMEKADDGDFKATPKQTVKLGEYYTPYVKVGDKNYSFIIDIKQEDNIIALYKKAGNNETESKKHKLSISGNPNTDLIKGIQLYCEKRAKMLKKFGLDINIPYQTSRKEEVITEDGFKVKKDVPIEPRIWFILESAFENKKKVPTKYGGEVVFYKKEGGKVKSYKFQNPTFELFNKHMPSGSSGQIIGSFRIDNFFKGAKDITFTFSISNQTTLQIIPITRITTISKEKIKETENAIMNSNIFKMMGGDEETETPEENEENTNDKSEVFTTDDLNDQNDTV